MRVKLFNAGPLAGGTTQTVTLPDGHYRLFHNLQALAPDAGGRLLPAPVRIRHTETDLPADKATAADLLACEQGFYTFRARQLSQYLQIYIVTNNTVLSLDKEVGP